MGHQTADQCAECHGHQKHGRRYIGPSGKLKGDWNHDCQCPNIFYESRQDSHNDHEYGKLGPDGGQVRHKTLYSRFHQAGARHTGTHNKCTAHDNDDFIAKTAERRLKGHDPDGESCKERAHRHDIIANTSPDESNHHQADDGKGQILLRCHGVSRLYAMSIDQERSWLNEFS